MNFRIHPPKPPILTLSTGNASGIRYSYQRAESDWLFVLPLSPTQTNDDGSLDLSGCVTVEQDGETYIGSYGEVRKGTLTNGGEDILVCVYISSATWYQCVTEIRPRSP